MKENTAAKKMFHCFSVQTATGASPGGQEAFEELLAKLPLVKHFAFMHLAILKTSNCKEFIICFVENCFTAFSFLKKKMRGERTCFL